MSKAASRPGSRYARIWAAVKAMGLSRDELHDIVNRETGKQSLTELTDNQVASLGRLLWDMEAGRAYGAKVPARFRFEETPGGISLGQYKKIVALMCELRKLDESPGTATIEQRVAGIIRSSLHISATPENPYQWLKYYHGVKLIETIKGMLDTAQRKAQARRESG